MIMAERPLHLDDCALFRNDPASTLAGCTCGAIDRAQRRWHTTDGLDDISLEMRRRVGQVRSLLGPRPAWWRRRARRDWTERAQRADSLLREVLKIPGVVDLSLVDAAAPAGEPPSSVEIVVSGGAQLEADALEGQRRWAMAGHRHLGHRIAAGLTAVERQQVSMLVAVRDEGFFDELCAALEGNPRG